MAVGSTAEETARGRLIERFGASSGRILGVVALAIAGFALVDAVLSGLSRASLLASCLAVLAGTACWMVLLRPRVTAYARVLVVTNMASDSEIPWHLITSLDLRQTLRIYAGDSTIHAVAIGRSTRQLVKGSRPGYSLPDGQLSRAATPAGDSATAPPSAADQILDRLRFCMQIQHDDSLSVPAVVRRWALPELFLLAVSGVAAVVLLLT